MASFTLFKTLLTSLANSLEHTSKWNIFPQFETQAPKSCEDIGINASLDTTQLCMWEELVVYGLFQVTI